MFCAILFTHFQEKSLTNNCFFSFLKAYAIKIMYRKLLQFIHRRETQTFSKNEKSIIDVFDFLSKQNIKAPLILVM